LKIRAGKGFTLEELKEAGMSKKVARTLGVSVDYRRRNKSAESLQENVQRLKVYKNKLVVFPRKSKAKKGDTARSALTNVVQNTCKDIIPLPKPVLRIKARAIKPEEKKFMAYATLRKSLRDAKNYGKRQKALKEEAEKAEKATKEK